MRSHLNLPSLSRRAVSRRAAARGLTLAALLSLFALAVPARAQNFKETRSGAQYVHHIQLYDANGVLIDPAAPNPRPYSPMQTCMKCHDYKAIAHGYHFNAAQKQAQGATDRPGEPWIYTDARSGTQMPLSYRDRPGLFKPKEAGLTRLQFLLAFGRQMPGGGVGESAPEGGDDASSAKPQAAAAPDADEGRFAISGNLEIDCMICHSNSGEYSHERWIKQIAEQNFAWAPTYALGIGRIKGSARTLPDDFDPAAQPAEGAPATSAKLPQTQYDLARFDEEKQIFFDIIRKPPNNACYQCHTTRPVGEGSLARWTHDEDVHVKAGISCVDCHRNDIGHHTVRGYEGEKHPTGADVRSFSCRGCHIDAGEGETYSDLGGRLGAPRPLHKGIPPVHFDLMSCTSCHSGPLPGGKPNAIQTSMAHGFGLANQTREDSDLPLIVQPVFLDDAQGIITPHRMVWPAYWAWMQEHRAAPGYSVTPMDPTEVYTRTLRRVLRIRSDFRAEASKATLTAQERKAALGDAADKPDAELSAEQKETLEALLRKKSAETFAANLAKVLAELAKKPPGEGVKPVYIANGKVWSLDTREGGTVSGVEHPAAKPYAWPLAHNVRPARQSLGVIGCTECHAKDAPIFYGQVAAVGPATEVQSIARPMHELMGEDPTLLNAWEQSFGGRPLFKWVGFIAIGAVTAILVLFLLLALNGSLKLFTRRSSRDR